MKPILTLLSLLAAASCGAQTNISRYVDGIPVEWDAWHTLTYSTNVVESDNHQGDPPEVYWQRIVQMPAYTNWNSYGGILQRDYVPPTERTWTTNIAEHLTVTLRVNGEDRTLTQERVVSSRSYTERLESKWVAKRQATFEDVIRDDGVVYSETNNGTVTIHWRQSPGLLMTNRWPATKAYLMESPK